MSKPSDKTKRVSHREIIGAIRFVLSAGIYNTLSEVSPGSEQRLGGGAGAPTRKRRKGGYGADNSPNNGLTLGLRRFFHWTKREWWPRHRGGQVPPAERRWWVSRRSFGAVRGQSDLKRKFPGLFATYGFAGFLLVLLFSNASFAARTYTVTIPPNTTCGPIPSSSLCVTMGDQNFVTLPHRVTHTGDDNKIKRVTFNLPVGSNYNFNSATPAPAGWEVKSFSPLSVDIRVIGGGTGILPGEFLDFDLVVTGVNDQAIPSLPQDVTETALSSVIVTGGGFSIIGSLPQWIRKSLEILLLATPPTIGVGGTITLEMQITNHSSAIQTVIASIPEPPTRIYTLGASVSQLMGPTNNPDPMTLASGEAGTITWTFQAGLSGTVTFEASVGNATPATSIVVRSDTVVIGNLTAAVDMDSTTVISGQSVKVTLTITNNGATSLTNVTLRMVPNGTAGSIDCDGDTFNDKGMELTQSIGLLGPGGMSVSYEWTCIVTGTVGQTYYSSGYATADGPVTTVNAAVTSTGTISVYSVTVDPSTVASSSAPPNKTFSWTVYNQGNQVMKEVRIGIPSGCSPPPSPCDGWEYVSANPGANWTLSIGGTPVNLVTFTSNNPVNTYGIQVGSSRTFTITFSSVPAVDFDIAYNFPVTIVHKKKNEATINTTIIVTGYSLVLIADPTSIPGNESSASTITATLSGPSPAGKTITFTTTAGILSGSSAVTDATGVATVTLTSSIVCGATPLTATVTGSYGNASGAVDVNFDGIGTGGNLSYVGGFLFERTNPSLQTINPPIIVDPNDQGYFQLDVKNTGCDDSVEIFITGSSLTIGTDIYTLTSTSDPDLAEGESATLQFGDAGNPVTICAGSGSFTPRLTIDGRSPAGGPDYDQAFAADKAPPGDTIPDTVTITGTANPCAGGIRILDWREVR